jgi:hypothetical protein
MFHKLRFALALARHERVVRDQGAEMSQSTRGEHLVLPCRDQ